MRSLSDVSVPEASWCDDDVRDWARIHGYGRYPKAKVRLATIHPQQPDLAIVHFDRKGCPIDRVLELRP